MGWFRRKPGRAAPAEAGAPEGLTAAQWKARGNAALGRGNLAEAIRCYENGVQAYPAEGILRLNLGFALLETGQLAKAAERLEQALALHRPGEDFAHEAHHLLARVHAGLGRPAEALRSCEAALHLHPDFAEAVEQGVSALRALRRHADAVQWARRLLALRPAMGTRMLLARTLLDAGQNAEAADLLGAVCAEAPENRDASILCFNALFRAARFADALAEARRLLALAGPEPVALGNIAAAEGRLGRPAEALAALDEAMRLKPGDRSLLVNRTALLSLLGRARDAVACAREALGLYPDDADLHWNLAVNHLLLGEFEPGWAEHEWRNRDGSLGSPAGPTQVRWRGEPLQDRTLFLYGEQGFGDNIQFVRFVPEMARRARRVYLQVLPALEPLMTQLPVNCVLVPHGTPLPEADYECPLMSLPAALRTTEATIPAEVPYLRADPERVQAWRRRLPRGRLNVGISCSGKPTHFNDLNRSIPLATFLQAAAEGCGFVIVQPQLRDADRAALAAAPEVLDAGRELRDFADTAALVEALDLVVSVDTGVAHLAGALAKPVWILLPRVPDWRWMLDRADSPWYPTARLYRQPVAGDWSSVLAQVRADLAARARGPHAGRTPSSAM